MLSLGGTSTSTDAVTVMLPQCDQKHGMDVPHV